MYINHERRLIALEKKVSSEQSQIDALTARITTAVTDLQSEIDALKNANPSIDFSGIDAAVDQLSALDTANQPPAPPVS